VSARLTEAIAGDPRLGDLNNHLADLVVIADAYLVIGQAINSEVLTKSTRLQVVSAEFGGPVVVGGERHLHSAVLSYVSIEITLTVAVDVEPANHARPVDRCFPNPGVHGSIAPAHVLGHTDIYRYQFGHRAALTSRLTQECDLKLHRRIRASPLGHGRDDNGYGHAAVNAVQALVIIGFYSTGMS
jgi:hypothetical protein